MFEKLALGLNFEIRESSHSFSFLLIVKMVSSPNQNNSIS